jgi:hypothetical protein
MMAKRTEMIDWTEGDGQLMLVKYPRITDEGEPINWEEATECWYSTAHQGSKLWEQLHIGALSASKLTTWLGKSKFSDTPEVSARQCVGLSSPTFSPEQQSRMQLGMQGESQLRDWYAQVIGQPIREVGIAVWKLNSAFRASLDGIYGDRRGVEFKITEQIYPPLVQYYQARNRGYHNLPPHDHLWASHYNQMLQSMVVTGLQSMDYVVSGYRDNQVYIETLYPDLAYWDVELYQPGVKFLQDYVAPLMRQHGILRIDPHLALPSMSTMEATISPYVIIPQLHDLVA